MKSKMKYKFVKMTKMNNFLEKFQKNITVNQLFIIFIVISFFFILIYPNFLFPDFDNLNRNFKNVLEAFFSGSTVVKSKTFGGSTEEHKLLLDQLFLTPQLKIIQFIDFFFDISIIKYADLNDVFVKFYFFIITVLLIFFLNLADDIFSDNKKDNHEKKLIFILSLLFPGVLMSITAPSSEAVFSVFSIFLFTRIFEPKLNIKQGIFYFSIFTYSYFLDSGNWFIVSIFIFNIMVSYILIKFSKTLFYIIFIMSILFIFLFVNEIIHYLVDITESHKIKRIIGDIQNTPIQNREPFDIIKRYLFLVLTLFAILTSTKKFVFTSLIFITYLAYAIFINYYRKRVTISNHINDYELIVFLNLIFLPFVIVYALPLHAYGKYYIFLIPIIFKIILFFISIEKLLKLNTIFTIFFVINIIIIA